VDLAVRSPGDTHWRLAVLVDGPGWASRPTVADRDGAPALLTSLMCWPAVMRVWLPDWLRDPAGVVARLVQAARSAPTVAQVLAARTSTSALPDDSDPPEPRPADDLEDAQPTPGRGSPGLQDPRPADDLEAPQPGPPRAGAPGDVVATAGPGSSASDALAPGTPDWGTPTPAPVETPATQQDVLWFHPAPAEPAGSRSTLDHLLSVRSRRTVTLAAAQALAVEGPMTTARLVRHVAHRFGYSRLGARKQADLESFVRATFDADEHGFCWPPGTDRSAPLPPRRTVKGDRTPAEVHPAELLAAVHAVLRAAMSADRRELTAETARTLGFRAAGSFTDVLGPVLDHAVTIGDVIAADGRYRLAQPR